MARCRRAQRRCSKYINLKTTPTVAAGIYSVVSGRVVLASTVGVCDSFPDVEPTAAVAAACTNPPYRIAAHTVGVLTDFALSPGNVPSEVAAGRQE